jgi:hypothetical protein
MALEMRECAGCDGEAMLLAVALGCLPPLEATVIDLRTKSRLSFDEIGQRIGGDCTAARAAWGRGLMFLGRVSKVDLEKARTRGRIRRV